MKYYFNMLFVSFMLIMFYYLSSGHFNNCVFVNFIDDNNKFSLIIKINSFIFLSGKKLLMQMLKYFLARKKYIKGLLLDKVMN